MESSNTGQIVKKLYDSNIYFFTTKTLRDVFGNKKESAFFKLIVRLIRDKILIKVEKNKYILNDSKINDFELANFLYTPSYISFETALNLYNILPQFPYEVTSATTKKTAVKKIQGKAFSYSHLDKSLYWGFKKRENFLIADAEKAFLDQVYLVAKGIKNLNFGEIDLSQLKKEAVTAYLNHFPKTNQFIIMINKLQNLRIV